MQIVQSFYVFANVRVTCDPGYHWKKCRQNLGRQFKAHWNQFGFESAPFPEDEFGDPRPPAICLSFVGHENLYSCEEIAEPNPK